MTNYPTLADIADDLDASLHRMGFSKTKPAGEEVLRYFAEATDYGFTVGIEEETEDEEEPEFNHVNLVIEYDLPVGTSVPEGEDGFPNAELMGRFFRDTGIYHHSTCFVDPDYREDGKVKLAYHIGFEKDKTSRQRMLNVLSKIVPYFANYVELNLDMMTADLGE